MTEYAFVVADGGWDESKHPRVPKGEPGAGEFGGDGSGGAADSISVGGTQVALKGTPDGKGTPDDPIYVGKDINRAVELLAQDKSIRLDDEKVASVVVSRLGEYAQQLRDKGEKAPDFDLCNVSVGDTNLFCEGTLGVPRQEMPQMRGVPEQGSLAEDMLADMKKEDPTNTDTKVSIEDEFLRFMGDVGVSVEDKTVEARMLRATQNELNGGKTGTILNGLISGEGRERFDAKPIWTTRDGYVLDGHHRWVAGIAQSLLTGGAGGTTNVREIGLDIGTALDLSREFARYMGIKQEGVAAFAILRLIFASGAYVRFEFDESKHPRGGDAAHPGRFSPAEGDDSTEMHQIIDRKLGEAKDHEPDVKRDLVAIATTMGGEMTGLKFDVKTPDSMERKIRTDAEEKNLTIAASADQIHDALRFTMTFPTDEYSAGTIAAAHALYSAGYKADDSWADRGVKNTWLPETSPYRGLNVRMIDPSGYRFELQFHTPESFVAKEANHKDFEIQRELPPNDPQREVLDRIMSERAQKVPTPRDVGHVSGGAFSVEVEAVLCGERTGLGFGDLGEVEVVLRESDAGEPVGPSPAVGV